MDEFDLQELDSFDQTQAGPRKLGLFIKREYHRRSLTHPGRWRSLTEFGSWLIGDGFSQSTFSTWCVGTKAPGKENLEKLADKLGDEVYDHLGRPRPIKNKPVAAIDQVWQKLSRDAQKRIMDAIWNELPPNLQDKWYRISSETDEQEQQDLRGGRKRPA